MMLGGFFQPVKSITPEEVRRVVKEKGAADYCLIDVRQPAEYAEGHLPGAKLIPLGELQARIDDIDTTRPVIVYCRSGNRSRSAVGLLNGAGRGDVFNMTGGILAYNGVVASGPPEAGIFCFPANLSPEQLVAMAWYVEDGSQRFCEKIIAETFHRNLDPLPADWIRYKKEHKQDLTELYRRISQPADIQDFPAAILPAPSIDVMAGCTSVSEAIEWSQGKSRSDILDLVMALEANTFDLYLKLGRQVESTQAREVFFALAEKEKTQLNALAKVFERTIGVETG